MNESSMTSTSRQTSAIKAISPGKLNLTFNILGDLPGGYHEVETLMQTVDIHDELTFRFEPAEAFRAELVGLEFAGATADVPMDQNNLVIKAAYLFQKNNPHNVELEKYNLHNVEPEKYNPHNGARKSSYRISIYLKKSVPVAGGMGGGSGNAAATLMALNKWFDYPFSNAQLAKLAGELGADVAFFIEGGTQLGTHRGDLLEKLECPNILNFLIVGPTLFGLQTAEVYRAYDESKSSGNAINTRSCAELLQKGDVVAASGMFANCFEPIVFQKRPELRFLYDRLSAQGGLCVRLTGSGPTLYVCTESADHSKAIQERLVAEQAEQSCGWHQYPTMTFNSWISSSTQTGVTLVSE